MISRGHLNQTGIEILPTFETMQASLLLSLLVCNLNFVNLSSIDDFSADDFSTEELLGSNVDDPSFSSGFLSTSTNPSSNDIASTNCVTQQSFLNEGPLLSRDDDSSCDLPLPLSSNILQLFQDPWKSLNEIDSSTNEIPEDTLLIPLSSNQQQSNPCGYAFHDGYFYPLCCQFITKNFVRVPRWGTIFEAAWECKVQFCTLLTKENIVKTIQLIEIIAEAECNPEYFLCCQRWVGFLFMTFSSNKNPKLAIYNLLNHRTRGRNMGISALTTENRGTRQDPNEHES